MQIVSNIKAYFLWKRKYKKKKILYLPNMSIE